jgi:DNA-binding transcriptional LysR family regulator
MELRHLRYFVTVAEERHFGRAAARLNMAQPPLSQQIRALERELGVDLFVRGPRGASLTPAGNTLLEEAYQILTRVAHAAEATRAVGRGESGLLRVGFVSSAAYSTLPDAVKRFREAHPGVALVLQELTTALQLEGLRAGDLDLALFRAAIGFVGENLGPDLAFEPVAHEPYVLALPVAHPLAAHEALALSQVGAEPFVGFPRRVNPSMYDELEGYCRAAGFSRNVVQEATLMQTIVSLVGAGLGLALVPASLQRLHLDGVAYRPLLDEGVETELVAVRRREAASLLMERFIACLRGV